MKKSYLFIGILFFLSVSVKAHAAITLGFDQQTIGKWESKSFSGETQYSLVIENGKSYLHAKSAGAASGLIKKREIDLNKTPILTWSWKIASTLNNENERTKKTDDFVARVYVIFSDGPFVWQTKTLNYVWSNDTFSEPVLHGTINADRVWTNPYTDNARMFAIRSRQDETGTWFSESRNIKEDIAAVFGIEVEKLSAIAIMTDTDQTGQMAEAWYRSIQFVAE